MLNNRKHLVVILAAGQSTRLAPFTSQGEHKSMIRLLGRPILAYVLDEFKKVGGADIIIVVNKANTDIKEYFGDGSKFGVSISYAEQGDLPGMGEAILAAKEQLTRPFFVVNPNHINAAKFITAMEQAAKDPFKAVLLGKEVSDGRLYGMLALEGERATGIVEKPEPAMAPSNVRVVGMYLLTPEFLPILSNLPSGDGQFEEALSRYVRKIQTRVLMSKEKTYSLKYPWHLFKLAKGLFKSASPFISPKAHIHPSAVLEGDIIVNEGAFIAEHAVIRGPCYIGKRVRVGNHALVRESIVEEDCLIGAHAEVARSIFMAGSHMHSGYVGDSIVGRKSGLGAGFITANRRLDGASVAVGVKKEKVDTRRTSFGALIGHNVRVGIKVGTMPGVVIHSDSIVGPGTIVFKDVPHGGKVSARFNYR